MANFLRKGKREHDKKLKKQGLNAQKEFQKTLITMNHVFMELIGDETMDIDISREEFEEKVSKITSRKLTEKQLDMIYRDVTNPQTYSDLQKEENGKSIQELAHES